MLSRFRRIALWSKAAQPVLRRRVWFRRGLDRWCIAAGLFLAAIAVYWEAVPGAFNTIYTNRRFFDSDGEFITRQFTQGKTFTHNDHLLYHLLGSWTYAHAGILPKIHKDAVDAHKALSVLSGALGLSLLYLLGLALTSRRMFSLAAALLVGGSAGWLFFSSTVDTYLPCLAASIGALGSALLAWRTKRAVFFAATGALSGLAFLLRTDSILLAALGLVLLGSGRRVLKHGSVMIGGGLLVGVLGYFMLAHAFYDVAWRDVPAWCSGSLQRPEAAKDLKWGVAANLSWPHFRLTALNHVLYGVLLPGLEQMRSTAFLPSYSNLRGGLPVLVLYGCFWAVALAGAGIGLLCVIRDRAWACLMAPALALAWLVSRLVFYTWWDPYDPFLFSAMSVPVLWMAVIYGGQAAFQWNPAKGVYWAECAAIFIMALAVWAHNWAHLIVPLRDLTGG